MSRWWKIVMAIAIMLPLLIIGAGLGFIAKTFGWPTAQKFLAGTFRGTRSRPLTARTFERTPARLVRGRYLVSSLANCFKCHSQHEPGGEPLPANMGAGTVETIPGLGLQITFPNLTPDVETGAGSWTDDMFARGQFAKASATTVGHSFRLCAMRISGTCLLLIHIFDSLRV
jgi:hypothetical protein